MPAAATVDFYFSTVAGDAGGGFDVDTGVQGTVSDVSFAMSSFVSLRSGKRSALLVSLLESSGMESGVPISQ